MDNNITNNKKLKTTPLSNLKHHLIHFFFNKNYLAFVHEQTCIYYVILVIGSSMLGSVHHQNLSEKKEEDILS